MTHWIRAVGGVAVATLAATASAGAAQPSAPRRVKAAASLTASDTGVTPTTIKLGYITPQTGVAASTFKGGEQGALARIKLQNAQGGVDGRKLELVTRDDGTGNNKTQAQDLVENEKVFGVIDLSPIMGPESAAYLNQQGVPVTGLAFDAEWGQQPNSNMFSYTSPVGAPFDGKYFGFDGTAKYLKSIGVTKLAALGLGISDASTLSIKGFEAAAKSVGIKPCYENLSVGFGQASFATEALAIKQAGCNGVVASMVDSSDVGLSGALTQAGVAAKTFYFTGYDQNVLDDRNASAALEGAYFNANPNFTDPTAATKGMVAAIKKYAPAPPKGIPSLGVISSYFAADVMIHGLELAGQSPTRAAFISTLRKQSGYTGNGLFAPVNFSGFATSAMIPAQACTDYVQLSGGKFKTVKRHVCGQRFTYSK